MSAKKMRFEDTFVVIYADSANGQSMPSCFGFVMFVCSGPWMRFKRESLQRGSFFFVPTTQNADADILTQTLFWLQTKRMVGLTALASNASSTRSAGANERLNRSLYVTSLRAKRSNPAFHVLLWIASSLRSSQ
jgi:hypothetical protein